MKKILSILIFLVISQTSFAGSLDYKGLKKLSKNNTFMDDKGKPYSEEKIVDKKKWGLIVVASRTINFKAKAEIKDIARNIARKNKFSFYKEILITLNKKNLKKNLNELNLKYSGFLIVPLFLFRGRLLESLRSVVKEINKKKKKKFILCSHVIDYKEIYTVIKNLIKS